MAATKRNAMVHEEARRKIKISQLVNRLTNHVLGKVEMSSTQVTAASVLLKKVLPDLTSTELTGDVNHNYVAMMPNSAETTEEWEKRYHPTLQ